jgi:hypothetical protein
MMRGSRPNFQLFQLVQPIRVNQFSRWFLIAVMDYDCDPGSSSHMLLVNIFRPGAIDLGVAGPDFSILERKRSMPTLSDCLASG